MAPLLLAGCGGFQNPAGLTRRGANVEVLSSCSDRGLTELTVIDAFLSDDSESDNAEPDDSELEDAELDDAEPVDLDVEPLVLYSMSAPEGDVGEPTLTLREPPSGWTTTGSTNSFGLSDRIIIEVTYGDADGASTRLRLEQIAVGAIWVDDENVEADAFTDQIRECDPGITIDGRSKTVLTLLAVVAGLAVIGAPLVFLWSLVQDRQR